MPPFVGLGAGAVRRKESRKESREAVVGESHDDAKRPSSSDDGAIAAESHNSGEAAESHEPRSGESFAGESSRRPRGEVLTFCHMTDRPGALARTALAFTAWTERWVPDAFIFALLATLVVVVAALAATPATPLEVVDAWGNGFWDLIPFTLQMSLIIITGHVLATSAPMGRLIRAIAGWPASPRGAVALVTFFALVSSWFNWGFSLIFSAVLAREVARRVAGVDYRALAAASFLGLGSIWAQGLSGSAALQMATPGALQPRIREIVAGRRHRPRRHHPVQRDDLSLAKPAVGRRRDRGRDARDVARDAAAGPRADGARSRRSISERARGASRRGGPTAFRRVHGSSTRRCSPGGRGDRRDVSISRFSRARPIRSTPSR